MATRPKPASGRATERPSHQSSSEAASRPVHGRRHVPAAPRVPLAELRLAAPERDGVTLADLAASIRTLSPGQRAAFVLHKVEGRPYREVAAALGCSEEAARSRVAEAMKKVKEATR